MYCTTAMKQGKNNAKIIAACSDFRHMHRAIV